MRLEVILTFGFTLLCISFTRIKANSSLNFTATLLYPFSDSSVRSFSHYIAAFWLAVEKINEDGLLGANGTLLYEWLDTCGNDLKTIQQLSEKYKRNDLDVVIGPGLKTCSVQARLASAWNIPMFGYLCSEAKVSDKNIYPTFARTAPTDSQLTAAIILMLKKFRWKMVGIFYFQIERFEGFHASLEIYLKINRIEVTHKKGLDPFNSFDQLRQNLREMKRKSRVILLLMDKFLVSQLLIAADMEGMTTDEFVFVLSDYSSIYSNSSLVYLMHGEYFGQYVYQLISETIGDKTSFERLKRGLLRMMLVVPKTENGDEYKLFENRILKRMKNYLNCSQSSIINPIEGCQALTVPPEASYLYDAVTLYALAVNKTLENDGDPRNGTDLLKNALGMTFQSARGYEVYLDTYGNVQLNFSLLTTIETFNTTLNATITGWKQFGYFERSSNYTDKVMQILRTTNISSWVDRLPPAKPKCGFEFELCPAKPTERPVEVNAMIISGSVIGGFLVIGLYIGLFIYRRHVLLTTVSWRLEPSDFIYSGKEFGSKVSFEIEDTDGIIERQTQIFSKVAIYKSRYVSIRHVNKTKIEVTKTFLKEMKTMLDINHDNINRFVGVITDNARIDIVFDYCSKGSLQDVLANDDIKLDLMFITSFIKDIIKGMLYLHSSLVGSHGRLNSSNCTVDSRWLVKITDYGLNRFHHHEKVKDQMSNVNYTSLLWTAPELLPGKHRNHQGTQKGDVYSFGIILQEILTRSEPYFSSNCEPQEIIERVKASEEPPFRPVVSLNNIDITDSCAFRTNALTLMKLCWAEQPEIRPSFPDCKKFMGRVTQGRDGNVFEHIVKMLEKYSNNLEELVEDRTKQLTEEKRKTDELIYRMLPRSVADQLKRFNSVEAERFEQVTIYFSDIVGFTTIAGLSTAMQIVNMLNDLYTLFDGIVANYDVYKVETIGDAYMVVSGLPLPNGDKHASEIADLSLHLVRAVKHEFRIRHFPDRSLEIRIGVHSGSVAAGVVGIAMPRYCLFGDTVNRASRMESSGQAQRIHISFETVKLLEKQKKYNITKRKEKVELKNVGVVQTYWLEGRTKPNDQTSPTKLHHPLIENEQTVIVANSKRSNVKKTSGAFPKIKSSLVINPLKHPWAIV